jgi:uncharacterized protein (DUF427 family)
MKAVWNGVVVAESNDTIEVEGNHYFPRRSVDMKQFSKSDYTTVCPWKGTASYLSVDAGGESRTNVGWYYQSPKEEAANIKDYVAFWRGVEVSES